jgi:hypothetical protein
VPRWWFFLNGTRVARFFAALSRKVRVWEIPTNQDVSATTLFGDDEERDHQPNDVT